MNKGESMKEKVLEAYNRLAADYEKNVDTQSGHNAYYERPAMMKLMPENLNRLTVLDAGCAAGWYTEQLVNRGAAVTAIDLSPEMVAACKRRVGDKAAVLACDLAGELPFQEAAFDLIVSSLTLHYIDDWTPTFREFHRVLKPGGTLLYSVHHPFMDFSLFDRPDYFAHEVLTDIWNKKDIGPVEVTFYRRPLQEVINITSEQFSIEQIVEPRPDKDYRDRPEARSWYEKWDEHLSTYPHFFIVKARRR